MIYFVLLAIIIVLVYLLLIFPTQWLKVERINLPIGLGIKVLQISDLHVEKIRISAKSLDQLIRTERPTYIFITGDFTEKAIYLPKVQHYINVIASSGIPVFAVLGNHDHRLKSAAMNRLVKLFEHEGVKLLTNEGFDAGDFQIVGIDDWCSKKSKINQAFQHMDPSKVTIVLTHDPNIVLHLNREYSYLMAGHFHGMQFNLPFLFRFINKGKLAASGVYKGLHKGKYGSYYISKGISQAGPNARFLIRSEVTIHQL